MANWNGFIDFWTLEILDHLFGKGSYTPPTIYIGLSTTKPTKAGGNITEPSGGSYARKVTAASDWTVAASRANQNVNDITFVEATASWGTIAYFILFDAITAGNALAFGRLAPYKTTLNEELTASDTTITVTDASGLPSSGSIMIEDEEIAYAGKTGNDLTGCTRAQGGTTAHAHDLGQNVYLIQAKTIDSGDTAKFAAGDLKVQMP